MGSKQCGRLLVRRAKGGSLLSQVSSSFGHVTVRHGHPDLKSVLGQNGHPPSPQMVTCRRLARKQREAEWAAFNATRPDEGYEDQADLLAIRQAETSMGDFKLKSDPNYVAPEVAVHILSSLGGGGACSAGGQGLELCLAETCLSHSLTDKICNHTPELVGPRAPMISLRNLGHMLTSLSLPRRTLQ